MTGSIIISQVTACLRKTFQHVPKYMEKADFSCFSTSLSSYHRRTYSSSTKNIHSVAIVGSGPAGYYTAQQLLKGNSDLIVDIYEKLPVPFGLVRYGVAPDHPEVKNVIHSFTETGKKSRCNFIGHVEIGKDVSLQMLREAYSAVVLCYGASDDRILGIPGEDLPNCLSARSFVGWYNGIPENRNLPVSLKNENAVVLGHGNVALDVARILLTPINILEKTDICDHALEALRSSNVKRVFLVGRRGPLQVNFTIKELREMTKLSGVQLYINQKDVDGLDKIIKDLPRPRRRLTELLFKTAMAQSKTPTGSVEMKECHILFQRSPLKFLECDEGKTGGVEFAVNTLQGNSIETMKAIPTDEKEIIPCGLVLRSIGYKSLPLDPYLPFDEKKGVIKNKNSRVTGEKGLYCSGWASVGPVVVILGTMSDGFETGKVVLHDLDQGVLENKGLDRRNALLDFLQEKTVTFSEWEKIDLVEMSAGEKIGKPREKLVTIEALLEAAKS